MRVSCLFIPFYEISHNIHCGLFTNQIITNIYDIYTSKLIRKDEQ